MNLTQKEIRIIYHVMDCIGPDLIKKQSGLFELKPEKFREYTNAISLTETEYNTFCQLKQKLRAGLVGF